MSIANILKKFNSRDTRILPSINTLTKIIFITLIAIAATFFVKNILAANNIIKQTQDAQTKSNNAESWQLNSWNTNTVNLLTTLTGPLPFKEDGTIDESKYQLSGLLGTSTKMATAFYQPQASGVEYIAQVKNNFLGKPTYAQGVAFKSGESLQPLLPLWKILRNIVYALSSLVFIVIGVMIMLRVKISPQAVITIQNSIPKLVTSLILVTFSYAIAGLIIDLSYWIQGMVLMIFFSAKGIGLDSALFTGAKWSNLIPVDSITGTSFIYNFKHLATADFVTLSTLANATVPGGSMLALGGLVGQVVLGTIIGGVGGLLGSGAGWALNWGGGAVGWLVGAVGGLIFMIVLFILIAIWLIKLFFGLLTAYVTIIIQIITAPIMIGIGAFPNSKIGFSSWLMDLVSKVAVFPVVLIAVVFINYIIDNVAGMDLWRPSLLNTGALGGGAVIRAAIGLAGLAMISKLPTLVPEAIFMLKPSAFGKAIGENLTNNAVVKTGGAFGKEILSSGAGRVTNTISSKMKNENKNSSSGRPGGPPPSFDDGGGI
ncbi:MAG: hypothetical protein PHE32_00605 [Candidatus Shapirobacteria bacterium]|nr:hypothetical protein [Candidatus Shapirobacteria bacterium]MDD4410197.1 hypothetical protein [Candidatus Shapirobacteria bacterium]